MAKVDGLDGLCNIQDRHILCLTQALDFYAKHNLADLALSKNWSKSDMLQAVAQPLHNISNEYKRSFAFSIPTQKAKTKNGKDASPAIATYTVTMGLSLDEKNNFSLTKTGQCILNHDLSIPSYALTLLSKVGVYNTNNERVTNLLAQFCKYAKDNPNASYTKDDIKSKVLAGIGPNTYFDSRADIAFNAFLVSGFLSVSNDEKYIVYNDDYDLISFLAANGDNITPPNDEEESYMGDINKGIVELITEDNQYLFYPKYNDLINIKFGKYNTSLNKHNNFLNGPLQQIYYGAPGTGKSHEIDKQTNDDNSIRTTFHPDTDYATFVGAYKPMMDTVEEYALDATGKTHKIDYPNEKSSIIYKYEPQVFLKAYVEAWKRYLNKQEGEDDNYYLVIEEINRGNCAQIFGDLFQLLDREDSGYSSYAISPESAMTKYLAEDAQSADGTRFSDLKFSNVTKKREDGATKIIATADDLKAGKRLALPPNLHIWATMNTSDQSLFPIDSAFKRRWDWKYMPIKYGNNEWRIVLGDLEYPWTAFQKEINKRIYEATNSKDKQMGDWFVRAKANKISESLLLNKIVFYLWNDVCKDGEGDIFNIKTAEDKTETVTFSKFFEGNTTEKLQQWMAFLGIEGSKIDAKVEIDDEDDDETKNHDSNQPYKVTFPDGNVICKGNSWDTYVASLQKIGLDKAFPFGEQYTRNNKTMPLITKEKIEDQGQYKYQYIDGYYVLSGTGSQHRLLKKINEKLGLGLTIE